MKAAIHGVTMLAALLLAACSEPPPVQVLNSRVSARMSPVQPCNRPASVEYLPNGARISIPDTALFTVGRTDLSPCGEYAVASAVVAVESGVRASTIAGSGPTRRNAVARLGHCADNSRQRLE